VGARILFILSVNLGRRLIEVPVVGFDLFQNFSQFEELRGPAYFDRLSTGFDTAAA
jgi:hypothetical protein